MSAMEQIKQLLGRRIGVIPDTLGPESVERGVAQRREKIQCDSEAHYLSILLQENAEIGNLIDEIVVPESWFFRDTIPFQRLSEVIAKRLLTPSPEQPLRILSAPCANGEEPYSIAMILLDLAVPASAFHIKGVDISERLVSQAGKKPFGHLAFRGDNLEYRDKYFEPIGTRYQIKEPLRSIVHFAQANLTDPNFLADDPPYDVIFCRNVMIYLDEPSRQQVLQNLDRLLAPDGILFVGHAEASPTLARSFTPLNWPGAVAFRKKPPTAPKPAAAFVNTSKRKFRDKPTSLQKPRRRSPAPANRKPNLPPRQKEATPPKPEPSLEHALQLADAGQNREARRLCQKIIETQGPSAAAYFLLGNVQLAADENREAEQSFERTVYLEPEHHKAITLLFHLASSRGDQTAADRWKRRMERIALRSATH